jgi:transporter family protein
MWWIYVLLSVLFASLTAIFTKVVINGVNSNLTTAIRTLIILMQAWVMVLPIGEAKVISRLSKQNIIFLIISRIAIGLSWLFIMGHFY